MSQRYRKETVERMAAELQTLRKENARLREAATEARSLLRQHWSNNPNWRQGQEHTYMGRIDALLEAALGGKP